MSQSDNKVLTREVFVAGGIPSYTYNPRSEERLEDEVRSYLSQYGKALSISGPTKSGKTVLIERLAPESEAIWVEGSDLRNIDVLWRKIVDTLQLWDTLETSSQQQEQDGSGVTASIGIPNMAQLTGNLTESNSVAMGARTSRTRAHADLAREALKIRPTPVVIDDFHFVPATTRKEIARAVKSLITFNQVIMIAVPYDAFDLVLSEPDLGGRVWHKPVREWTVPELSYIASSGFRTLNVKISDDAILRLAEGSFGAPFLMQQLCHDLSISAGIHAAQTETFYLPEPGNFDAFFSNIANRTPPTVFSKLIAGSKERGQERVTRTIGNVTTDIYGAVLHGIRSCGPKPVIDVSHLKRTVAQITTPSPTGQQVISCLNRMTRIALENKGSGDPALVLKNDQVFISDPFLLFYLKWGEWQ